MASEARTPGWNEEDEGPISLKTSLVLARRCGQRGGTHPELGRRGTKEDEEGLQHRFAVRYMYDMASEA